MIDNLVTSINAGLTKVVGEVISKNLDAGKKTQEAKKAEIQRDLEDTKRVLLIPVIYGAKGKIIESNEERVPKTYNAKGQIIEYNESGRHFNTKV